MLRFLLRSAILPGLFLLAACEPQQSAPPQMGPLPVTVATPLEREIEEWDTYTGRFEAVERVEIRARVGGYLSSVNFEDGQIVQAGDLLFVVDPRPYEVAVRQAQARLREAQARIKLARADLDRAKPLLSKGNISQQVYDERVEALQEAQASLSESEAALDGAKLDLEFTQVRAPITGRVGRDQANVGNLISGGSDNATLLTTIVSLDPIHFYFEADEAAYLRYTRLSRTGERPSSRDTGNPVEIQLTGETGYPHKGRMDYVGFEIAAATGTMTGRAILDNKDGRLLIPGMFGRMRLLGSGKYKALLVPDEVIRTDMTSRFVYVVGEDNAVTPRPVELGPIVDGLRVIRGGLAADDRIVIKGLMRIRPGVPISPQEGEIQMSALSSRAG